MAFASPIYNPQVPYRGPITGGLRDGMSVTVQGNINPNPHDFRIDLLCGSHFNADVAFVFNPRFSQNEVVRNTQTNGQWGSEEKHGGFPLARGGPFDVRIDVSANEYKVYMNGRHFCDYRHRTPAYRVDTIAVEGSINVTLIKFDSRQGHGHHHQHHMPPGPTFPPSAPHGGFPSPPGPLPPSAPHGGFPPPPGPLPPPSAPGGFGSALHVRTPPLPFKSMIPGGMYPGRMVNISGTPSTFADTFAINLQVGTFQVDVPLHLNPRLKWNVFVRNSMQRGAWGPEEKTQPYFPFAPNRKFDITILCEQHQFKIAVNGQHFTEYRHRFLQLNKIDHISISGDVIIDEVRVQ